MQSVSMTDSQRKFDQFFHRKDYLTTKDEILPTRRSDSKESVHSSDQDELESTLTTSTFHEINCNEINFN